MLERFFTPYEPSTAVKGDRIAILAPHPDDEIFGCGGAILNWLALGKTVQAFIVSAGVVKNEFSEAGDMMAEKQRHKAQLRAQESCAAADLLGMPKPIFLSRQDGELLEDMELELVLLEVLRDWQPTTLVVPSIWEMHRDHRAIAQLGADLVQQIPSLSQLVFYEIGVPLQPNCLENITDNYLLKWQAMQCFKSQLALQRYDEQIKGLNAYRSYTLGLNVHFAEAYCCVAKQELDRFLSVWQPSSQSEALRSAEQELINKQTMLDEAIAKLSSMECSLSWRITYPLRKLKRWIGRVCS